MQREVAGWSFSFVYNNVFFRVFFKWCSCKKICQMTMIVLSKKSHFLANLSFRIQYKASAVFYYYFIYDFKYIRSFLIRSSSYPLLLLFAYWILLYPPISFVFTFDSTSTVFSNSFQTPMLKALMLHRLCLRRSLKPSELALWLFFGILFKCSKCLALKQEFRLMWYIFVT